MSSALLGHSVIPAKAGIQTALQGGSLRKTKGNWIPAFAGMTQLLFRGNDNTPSLLRNDLVQVQDQTRLGRVGSQLANIETFINGELA